MDVPLWTHWGFGWVWSFLSGSLAAESEKAVDMSENWGSSGVVSWEERHSPMSPRSWPGRLGRLDSWCRGQGVGNGAKNTSQGRRKALTDTIGAGWGWQSHWITARAYQLPWILNRCTAFCYGWTPTITSVNQQVLCPNNPSRSLKVICYYQQRNKGRGRQACVNWVSVHSRGLAENGHEAEWWATSGSLSLPQHSRKMSVLNWLPSQLVDALYGSVPFPYITGKVWYKPLKKKKKQVIEN